MSYLTSLSDFWTYSFLTGALLATFALSFSCGLLSPMIVAKRYAFLGSALSHSTLLGISLAVSFFASTGPLGLFLITLFVTLLLTLFLAEATYRQTTPGDSLIGIFYTVTMGLGIIVHAKFAQNQGDLMSYLFGNILLVEQADLWLGGLLSVICLVVICTKFSTWSYFLYDFEGAKRDGLPTKLYHYLIFILMTSVIVSSLKLAGTVLVSTLLIIPGVFALQFAKSMKMLFIISVSFSLIVSVIGLSIANFYNLPSGATLAVCQFTVLVLSKLLVLKKS